jgi:molybdopterin-containing oxidoreductase family membrane subunit
MAILRKVYGLEEYIRPIHFDNLGKILLAVSLLWFYFFFAETLTRWYGGIPAEMEVIRHRYHNYETHFITTLLCNVIIPVPLLAFKRVRNNIGAIFAISLIVNVGMFLERFLIIVPSLARQRLPYMWGVYAPTWIELSITAGAFAGFSLAYALFTKLFPIVAIWEVREGQRNQKD